MKRCNFKHQHRRNFFTSAVTLSEALVLSVAAKKTQMIPAALRHNHGCNHPVFTAAIFSLGEEILRLCGTDFAVKQTQDLRKESWGVCGCEPLEAKIYGDSLWTSMQKYTDL